MTNKVGRLIAVASLVALIPACTNRGEVVKMTRERDTMREELERVRRQLEGRNARVLRLEKQVRDLQKLGPDRPADIFAPTRLEIASRTGGADYDGKPGDDGVTVYIRLLDPDGHPVKVPGTIKVQILDHNHLGEPRLMGFCVFNDPMKLRSMWYEHFGTRHYTAECRFSPGSKIPPEGKVLVSVEFFDYLTGRTLTASKEVEVSPAP